MSKGLKALERLCENCPYNKPNMDGDVCSKCEEILNPIEQELKELDKIKARLTVVQMKISAHREECIQNMEHTDEDTFMHEASKITIDCLDWFRQLIQEVLS